MRSTRKRRTYFTFSSELVTLVRISSVVLGRVVLVTLVFSSSKYQSGSRKSDVGKW